MENNPFFNELINLVVSQKSEKSYVMIKISTIMKHIMLFKFENSWLHIILLYTVVLCSVADDLLAKCFMIVTHLRTILTQIVIYIGFFSDISIKITLEDLIRFMFDILLLISFA